LLHGFARAEERMMTLTAKRSLVAGHLPIWRSADRSFALYWAATTASDFGSMVSLFAVPMTAIQLLGATPAQIGYLRATEILPSALFGILAGVLADSCSRKRMMIIRDLGAGASLLLVALAYTLGLLDMNLLLAMLFFFGCFQVLGQVAESALLPGLVQRQSLVQANSRLETTSSMVNVTAPGLAGWLLQVFNAPFVILCDAASYFVSALLVSAIAEPRVSPTAEAPCRASLASIVAGLREIARNRPVRSLVVVHLAFAFLFDMIISLRILRAAEQLQIAAGVLGGLYMLSGFGGLVAAATVKRAFERFGLRWVVAASSVACGAGCGLLSVVGPEDAWKLAAVGASLLVAAFGRTGFSVALRSGLQLIVPDDLLGRVRGAVSFVYAWLAALGGVIAGTLAGSIGVATMIAAASIGLAALGCLSIPLLPKIELSSVQPEIKSH
jgi:MFS family permease